MQNNQLSSREDVFRNTPVPLALAKMVIPSIASQLIVLIYNMADTFFIGQTGNPHMVAGTSLILPIFNITLCISGLAGIGGGSHISRLLGKGEQDEARRTGVFSVYLGITVAALYALILGLFTEPILTLLGAGETTLPYAMQYVRCVIVAGGIPTVLSNTLAHLIRSVGQSRRASTGLILGGVLNIALDPLFMFVIMPEGQEVLGAGIATCISNCVSCLYFIISVLFMGRDSVISFNAGKGLPKKENIAAVFAVGTPSAVTTFLFDTDYMVIDRLMSAYRDTALAAIGIVLKAERFPLNIGLGICQGMMPLVAYNYTAGDTRRMRAILSLALKVGLIVAAVSIVLYEAAAPAFARFFIDEPETTAYTTEFFRIRILATPLMFLCFFTLYLFQSLGRGKISLFLGVSRWLLLNIPMLFILNRLFGMYGIVWSQVTADALAVLLSFCVYRVFGPFSRRAARK